LFMRGDRGPDFVQSWFALKWAILLLRVFSKVVAWVFIAILFVLVAIFPEDATQIILYGVGLFVFACFCVIVWAVGRLISDYSKRKRRQAAYVPYNPSTDMTTSNYRWDATTGGPVRDDHIVTGYQPISQAGPAGPRGGTPARKPRIEPRF
jgi:hypothetical protein